MASMPWISNVSNSRRGFCGEPYDGHLLTKEKEAGGPSLSEIPMSRKNGETTVRVIPAAVGGLRHL